MGNGEMMDLYGFYTGQILDAYEYLGCHYEDGTAVFRTYAPQAVKVTLIGEFSEWKELAMEAVLDGNFWECTVENVTPGMRYKYRIHRKDDFFIDHADPYGNGMEKPPANASVIVDMADYKWSDEKWMKSRTDCKTKPLNIYEVHFGSWKLKKNGSNYSYKELAKPLIRYVKEKGYTHLELMPLGEYPCGNSWGYQQTGFYSPTARYGTASELKYFIDYAHENGIGVILDFVPVHFAVDGFSLAEYDGTALYEYPYTDIALNEWGSKNFNHGRGEVRCFLQSCARYWLKEFHFDGLRMDAISNMIYWQGNKDRGENKGATDFMKHMNYSLKAADPSIMLIAEDSSSYDGVTRPVQYGGLGFDYKWDMGWMNDTLDYFRISPFDRRGSYHKLTFSMMYFAKENYLLPLSHDEVVHGKATIVQKMYGLYGEKFTQARALYLYMLTHPGKKLNFMGNEIAHFREWDEEKELDWFLCKYPAHDAFSEYMKDLNKIYKKHPAMYEMDYDNAGFTWVDCHQEDKCLYLFTRKSQKETLLVVLNFSCYQQEYQLTQFPNCELKLLIHSDDQKYDGNTPVTEKSLKGDIYGIHLNVSPYSGIIYQILPRKTTGKTKKAGV